MRQTLITNRARAMRKAMTEPEVMLWSRLRGRRPDYHDLGRVTDGVLLHSERLIAAEASRPRLAPSTTRSSPGLRPGSADGPPPAASRGR